MSAPRSNRSPVVVYHAPIARDFVVAQERLNEALAQAALLRSIPAPDTFLGRQTFEPFPFEGHDGLALPLMTAGDGSGESLHHERGGDGQGHSIAKSRSS